MHFVFYYPSIGWDQSTSQRRWCLLALKSRWELLSSGYSGQVELLSSFFRWTRRNLRKWKNLPNLALVRRRKQFNWLVTDLAFSYLLWRRKDGSWQWTDLSWSWAEACTSTKRARYCMHRKGSIQRWPTLSKSFIKLSCISINSRYSIINTQLYCD